MLNEVFGQKKRINLEEFKRINQEVSSEMFLSVLILLQNSLPCTENFYRYQKNFERYIGADGQPTEAPADGQPPANGQVKTIASPRLMSNLSPIASLAKQQGINFNPPAQSKLL